MTKKETIIELNKLGVEFDANLSAKELAEVLDLAQNPKPTDSVAKKGSKLFILLKSRAYFDDRSRVEPAVYVIDSAEVTPRISKLPTDVAEIYPIDSVPVDAFARAAKTAGIDTSKMKSSDVEEVVLTKVAKANFLFVR